MTGVHSILYFITLCEPIDPFEPEKGSYYGITADQGRHWLEQTFLNIRAIQRYMSGTIVPIFLSTVLLMLYSKNYRRRP